jgi:hypothetical protein
MGTYSRKFSFGRRFVVVATTYALLLHAFFAGAAGARLDGIRADEMRATGFVLCASHPDGVAQSQVPAPGQEQGQKIHCALCATMAHAPLLIAGSSALTFAWRESLAVVWLDDSGRRPDDLDYLYIKSRGPPHLA